MVAAGRARQDDDRLRALFDAARDVFGAPEAAEASARLRQCAAVCEDYADRVFTALHEPPPATDHDAAAPETSRATPREALGGRR
ncbi:Chromate resistance protein ChrB [Nonomuraea sp. NPDC049607]|uniref:Chromate resistance protein ChrB n=1 Tax=Nonomuraea sp. NPDC049607 TaxID=3154732 RepID=UPI00342F6280